MVTDRVFVDRDAPKALIQGVEDYTITSKPVQVSYLAEEENVIQTVRANILKEDIDGKKEETEITEWKTKAGMSLVIQKRKCADTCRGQAV